MTVIYLFNNDLRLSDHPGLAAAAAKGEVLPLYIHNTAHQDWPESGASLWWRFHSLSNLAKSIELKGGRLTFAKGDVKDTLQKICKQLKITSVFTDHQMKAHLGTLLPNIEIHFVRCNYVLDPDQCLNLQGRPYQVFTPYWRAAQDKLHLQRVGEFKGIFSKLFVPGALGLYDLALLPKKIPWHLKFDNHWEPGETGALALLEQLDAKIPKYESARDLPAVDGTSKLSPHLHFGEIHPARVFEALKLKRSSSADRFRTELGWREFALSMLHHFPQTALQPLRSEFKRFPWDDNPQGLKAWTAGMTGYPIVDAGMRQLWATGWMHNRVRMIVASFLTKDLRLHWLEGARWFWNTLVDADLPSNTLGWQWAAGCGADAAPYFRVFNPTLQGQKFDPEGHYVRRWVPELAGLDKKMIHTPWELGSLFRPKGYPDPIVDHSVARIQALKAFESLKAL